MQVEGKMGSGSGPESEVNLLERASGLIFLDARTVGECEIETAKQQGPPGQVLSRLAVWM